MPRREGGDASLLIGLVLGVAAGAAIAMVLTPKEEGESGAMLDARLQQSEQELDATRGDIQKTLDQLRQDSRREEKSEAEKAQEKIAGAREEVTKAQEAAQKSNVGVQKAEDKLAEAKDEAREAAEKKSEG
jgi:gas vesicle protein